MWLRAGVGGREGECKGLLRAWGKQRGLKGALAECPVYLFEEGSEEKTGDRFAPRLKTQEGERGEGRGQTRFVRPDRNRWWWDEPGAFEGKAGSGANPVKYQSKCDVLPAAKDLEDAAPPDCVPDFPGETL